MTADLRRERRPAMHTVSPWLWDLLRSLPAAHHRLLDEPAKFRLQIIVSVLRDREAPETHVVRPDAEYFYPASSVKFLGAAAALCFMRELRETHGIDCDEHTPLAFRPLFDGQALEDRDDTNLDGGTITLAHQALKTLIVSDNPGFNRMYDLLGHRGMNDAIASAGLRSCRIDHRLSEFRPPQDQVRTRAVEIRTRGGVHLVPQRDSDLPAEVEHLTGLDVGRAFIDGGRRVDAPMSFARKNRISLHDLHASLLGVVCPDAAARLALAPTVPRGPRSSHPMHGFPLSDAHRALLIRGMTLLPRQSANPIYADAEHTDDFVKPLLPGLARVVDPRDLSITSKIGWAYGFLVENAIVSARGRDAAFAITACMFVCESGVINADEYEYDTIAKPLLMDLGEAIARNLGWDR